MSRSPLRAAFEVVAHNPALIISEIAWRWSFAITVWLLLAFTFFTYLHTLTVSNVDWYLLRSRVPPLMAQAISHVLQGSAGRLLRAAAVLVPTVSIVWIFAASLGRWASLRVLVEEARGRFRTVLGLHFLRTAVGLAAWIGYVGALIVAALLASRDYQDRPGLFMLVFVLLAIVIGFVHGQVRWYLVLANIIAVKDGLDAFASVARGFDAYRERRGAFLSAGAAIWALRFAAIVLASVASLLPMVGLDAVRWKTAVIALAIITVAYFAVADFLHVVRLAAYVEILRDEPEPAPALPAPEIVLPVTPELQPSTGTGPSS